MSEKAPDVLYWLVRKFRFVRESAVIIGIFNKKEDAEVFMESSSTEHEPTFVDGVLDLESLVDLLIKDRFWPIGATK